MNSRYTLLKNQNATLNSTSGTQPIANFQGVKYTPSAHERKNPKDFYIEVWQGLPNVDFKEVTTATGKVGIRHQSKEAYIWLTPEAREYAKRPSTIFSAVCDPTKGKNFFMLVDVEHGALEEIIEGVRTANHNIHYAPRRF